jgi:ABC-type uncharacterized transport system substrate-binding protein
MRNTGAAAGVALAAMLAAAPVGAHPHIFIDTGIELVFDEEGRLAVLQVVWIYDEFYSMWAIDDYGLDQDYTGELTEEERVELAAIYSNWDEDYAGDLYPYLNGEALALSGPFEVAADYRQGRIIIVHSRALEERVEVGAEPVVIRVYDPTYYTAYSIAVSPGIRGRDDCVAEVVQPDLAEAEARLDAALEEMIADGADPWEVEADFPEVGDLFAEEVQLRCASSS